MKSQDLLYELSEFTRIDLGSIRATLDENGDPLFMLVDVVKALGVKNPSDIVNKRLRESEYRKVKVLTSNGPHEANVITEGGLYHLILSTKKRTKSTELFKDWVFDEVLPALRHHGTYTISPFNEDDEIVPGALKALYNQREQNNKYISLLEQKLRDDQPLVEFAKIITTCNDMYSAGEIAAMISDDHIDGIKVGRNTLYTWLLDNGYIIRDGKRYRPAQKYINKGWFAYPQDTKDKKLAIRITEKGREKIIERFISDHRKRDKKLRDLGIVKMKKDDARDDEGFFVLIPKD